MYVCLYTACCCRYAKHHGQKPLAGKLFSKYIFTVNHNTVILSGIFFQQEFFQQKKEYPLFVDGTICIRPISNTDSSIFCYHAVRGPNIFISSIMAT